MRRRCGVSIPAFVAVFTLGIFSAQYCVGQDASYAWYSKMRQARRAMAAGRRVEALETYRQALAAAPDAEHAADTLFYTAQAHGFQRSTAISTYKRIINEYPHYGRLSEIYYRLGELHRSISLVRPDATPEEEEAASSETTDENAVGYFELAIAAAPEGSVQARLAKMYVAGIYMEVGRDKDGWRFLHELASSSIYDITVPAYAGPYLRNNDLRVTTSERLDETRRVAKILRDTAARHLVNYSLVADRQEALRNLKELIETYPGTDIQVMAEEAIQKL